MTNNLRGIRKGLCAFAKKCKGFKYTDSALITFLITGGISISNNVFSAENDSSIESQKKIISTDIKDFNILVKETRKENNKLIKKTNFELVKLMEQGDHVVKSPWASWQTGTNYMYNNWNGTYKGRGNKIKDEVLTRDTTGNLNKFLETGLNSTSYGSTNLGIVHEPDVEIKISAGIKPKIIDRQAPSYKPTTPEVSYPTFEPRFILSPVKPSAPAEITPTTFDPPALNFVGGGFIQNQTIGMTQTNIIVQNYEKYSTEGVFKITAGAAPGWLGTKWEGKLNVETTLDPTKNGSLTTGQTGNGPQFGMNTFINDLRDHNTMFTGEYELTDLGGRSWTKSFISYNPAGVGGDYSGYYTPGNRTSTFAGKLTLHGIPVPVNSNVLVGIEHQLWATSRNHPQSSSTLLNTGEIILASGNNVVGIMIDIERMVDPDRIPHKTINDGKIIINNQNSIGMDFGQYIYGYSGVFKVDVSLGNIIVNGKNNYGARMKNIFVVPQTDARYATWSKYYDMVTVTSGTGKKITVNGEENVGMAIGKSLSAVARESAPGANDTNPIANISDLNIEVAGEKNIGFLRLKDYSDNNTNDMILDSTTMGTFTFGNGAKNSSLVRTDKHGIQVKKDITATGIDDDGNDYTGSGNTVLHSNGETQHIYNYNTITVGKGFTKTVGMAATGTAASTIDNIVNEGTIDLQAKQSIGMYTDKFSQGKNTGSIKLSGVGDTDPSGNIGNAENIGISNKGKFEFSGNLEVNGKKSSGIYNTGTATIEAGPNPTDKANIKATNGATGLYSKGTGSTITSNAGDKLNINVEAGTTKEGLAVYAENQAQITLHDANITVNGGSAGAAAYDTGTKIDLTGATLKYDGNGYAAYSDGQGEIDLSNSNIELRGRSTLMNVDFSSSHRPITTSSTNVTVYSNDVVGINLNNLGTQNISNLSNIKNSLGVVLNPGTEGGQTFNKFKELAIDNGTINFDVATDKNEGDTTPGGFFFKKVLGQRLKLNVNENLTARLSSADANEFYNGQVVGLEANSSDKAVTNTEAQVNIVSGKTVDVARTDGTDKGGVGVFVNYGQVNNSGTINVEKDSSANSNAVGIYAVNGSEIHNNGTVNVSGKASIGLLGMAYRTDSAGNPITTDGFGDGTIFPENESTGVINMDGEAAIGMLLNNNKPRSFPHSFAVHYLMRNYGDINMSGNKAIGMSGRNTWMENHKNININSDQEGIGMSSISDYTTEVTNSATGIIKLKSSISKDKPNIGMFTNEPSTSLDNFGTIIGGDNNYAMYGAGIIWQDAASKIKLGNNSVGAFSNTNLIDTYVIIDGEIEIGDNSKVALISGNNASYVTSSAKISMGDNSFGFVLETKESPTMVTTFESNYTQETKLKNNSVYIYSSDKTATITNNTPLKLWNLC